MPSTFSGIEIGKRSLITHALGLNTVGHNMSNASVEGYSRQRVEMKATDPLYMPGLNREERAGQVGQGVETLRIERIKDMLLEGRIVAETAGEGYWEGRDKYLLLLEQVYNEPSEHSVRSLMDRFWESWQELSVRPSETGSRLAVLQRGKSLITSIQGRYKRLKEVRDMLEGDVLATVEQINSLGAEIAGLNEQIVKIEALGDNPNDLYDRRDLLTGRLATLADVTISGRDPDEFIIYTGGMHLVQGRHFEALITEPNPDNESYSRVLWPHGQELALGGGKLAALLELRDFDAREEIQKLDILALYFVDLVNEIHRQGFSVNGTTGIDFFSEYPFVNNLVGNYDRDGDGAFDASYIFRINGSNPLNLKDQIGLRGTLTLSAGQENIQIDYFPTDTVEEVILRINTSGAEVVARLNQSGRLSLKGVPTVDPRNPDFVLRHLEDSGEFLVGYAGFLLQSGPEGGFDWEGADAVVTLTEGAQVAVAPLTHPAGWIHVNPALERDPGSIASSLKDAASAAGDGSAALAIARLRTEPVMLGVIANFDEYFSSIVTEIGLKGEAASQALDTEKLVLKDLRDLRESISGVNMDEELATMIKFQHGYTAAARFVTEIDRMLDTIINRMAV